MSGRNLRPKCASTPAPTSRRGLRTALVVAGFALAFLAMGMLAPPAEAHEWNVESESESCFTYSFGTLCTVTTTLFRHHDSWCAGGPPFTWPLRAAWYSHCYRNQTSSYWR